MAPIRLQALVALVALVALAGLAGVGGACRGRDGSADESAGDAATGARDVGAPALSSTTSSLAPLGLPISEPTAKLDPPSGPIPEKPRALPARLPLLATEGSDDGPLGIVRVLDRFGIDGRIASARMAYYWLAPATPTQTPYQHTTVMCSAGVVTSRVISGSCTRDVNYIPQPGSRGTGGGIDGVLDAINLEFVEPEGAPSTITLASLFRPEVDAPAVVREACKSLPEDADGTMAGEPKAGDKPKCTVDAFVLTPDGLYVMWANGDELTARTAHRVSVPWSALGRKLRPEGAACSFAWSDGWSARSSV